MRDYSSVLNMHSEMVYTVQHKNFVGSNFCGFCGLTFNLQKLVPAEKNTRKIKHRKN